MVKIAVYSHKGGTGKTTSVFNLAGAWGKRGKKVLCVDTDAQGNLSRRLLKANIDEAGLEWFRDKPTFESLFMDPKQVNEAIYPSMIPLRGSEPKKRGIDIIPVKPTELKDPLNLFQINTMLGQGLFKDQMLNALNKIKRTRTHLYTYDYCLVDFSPTFNDLTLEALSACDYLVIPSTVDVNSLDGISQILDVITTIKAERNPRFELLGMFFTMSSGVAAYDRQMDEIVRASFGNRFFKTVIRQNTEVKWSLHYGVPLAWNKRTAKVTKDYENLADEIEERLG